MKRSLVSAIIPTVDRPNLLKRAIDSVESQTYRPLEIIVIGSSETPAIQNTVKEADVFSTKFISSSANSPAAARNIGIEQ
ncbi:MAG: glycosyltransferase family 2 protein, partial [Halobacteriaceae archaeon]